MSNLTMDGCALNAKRALKKAVDNNERDYDGGWWQIGARWCVMEWFIGMCYLTPARYRQLDEMEAEVLALTKAHYSSSDQATKGVNNG